MESVSDPSLVGTGKMKLNLASDLHSHQGRVGPQVILERHRLRSERKIARNAADGLGLNRRRRSQVLSALCRPQAVYSTTGKKPKQNNKTNNQNKTMTIESAEEEGNLTRESLVCRVGVAKAFHRRWSR